MNRAGGRRKKPGRYLELSVSFVKEKPRGERRE